MHFVVVAFEPMLTAVPDYTLVHSHTQSKLGLSFCLGFEKPKLGRGGGGIVIILMIIKKLLIRL